MDTQSAGAPLTAGDIKTRARELGFDLCGIARAEAYPELSFYTTWLSRGFAGDMHYLTRTADRRADARAVLPTAKSVIALATNYHTDRPYSIAVDDPNEALIARYAWGDDYHDVLGRRLDQLLHWMHERSPVTFDARAYVDTGPVQERVFAQSAGLGWIGKNTCLINPELGSWVFLSEILCSLDLDVDEPAYDQCGSCFECLKACPTGALVEPGVLDATRCVSYVTIELRGAFSPETQQLVGAHVYGCDICQEVCPWNMEAPVSTDPAWQPRPVFDRPRLDSLAALSDAEMGDALKGSAMRRAKREGLRRNIEAVVRNRDRAR